MVKKRPINIRTPYLPVPFHEKFGHYIERVFCARKVYVNLPCNRLYIICQAQYLIILLKNTVKCKEYETH